jgi:hypothetical protein
MDPGTGYVNTGNMRVANSLFAGGSAVISGSATVGTQFNAGGNIIAGARLRAAFGAYQSGDSAAGVILADFVSSLGTNGYHRDPTGLLIQWGNVGSVPVDNAAHLYNFPVPFSSACFAVLAVPGAFAPQQGAMMGSQAANLSQFYVTIACATTGGSLGTWFIAVGI